MSRDILTLCVSLAVSILFVYYNRKQPAYKKIEYSPFVHKPEFPVMNEKVTIHPASGLIHSNTPSQPKGGLNTYNVPDTGTSTDYSTMEDLMQLPLESGGFVYDPTESGEIVPKTVYIKYVKFQCTKIRESTTVELGGIRFFYKDTPVPFHKIQTWNPHTGESKKYNGESWSDSDQYSIIFVFSQALELDRYELKSSFGDVERDPIHWKLEGSMNGAFWTVLDDRTKTDTAFPEERGAIMSYIMRGGA